MTRISRLTATVNEFRRARGWDPHFEPKNLVISMVVEIGELAEHFQYKTQIEIDKHLQTHLSEVSDELCDVLWGILVLAHELNIDLSKAFHRKMTKNLTEVPLKLGLPQRPEVNLNFDFDELEQITMAVLEFRAQMNWTSYSHPRDWMLKMFEEVGELAEFFQWQTNDELAESFKTTLPELADELIDVLICVLMIFYVLGVDIENAFTSKMAKNALKYPLST